MVMAKNDFPESTGFTHPFLGYPISSHPQVVKIEDADGLFKDISRGHLQRQECIPPPFQAKRRVAAAFQEEEAAVDSMGTNPGADPRPQAALEELRTLAEAEETEVG